jgi:hypothetical protein
MATAASDLRPLPSSLIGGRTQSTADEITVLGLAARGFRLFPVEKRGKRALIKKWTERATCDAESLRAWMQAHPGCNWGVACGIDSRVFVLDIDGTEGQAAIRALSERHGHDWMKTLRVKTSRGAHLYFCYPDGPTIRNSTSKLAPGLDIRGTGGYAVVPPSVHSSGHRYDWENENVPIARAPEWLLELVRARAQTSATLAARVGAGLIAEGQRNATLLSDAGAMRRRGMTPKAIEAVLLAENAGRCQPPLPESEVREIVRSVSRYAPAPEPTNDEHETAALLEDVRSFIQRFLVVSVAQAVTLCLFVLYTYSSEQFECAPYLQITSAEKRSGKTRLLELLELLVRRPWMTARTSAAALVRKLAASHPTLLLDESDAAFSGDKEYSEALRGVLNAGHRKGGRASLCVGRGCDIKVVDFDVFGPKVMAGIGRLPDTVADRAIPVQFLRKRPGETVERFRPRLVAQDATDLRDRLTGWATEDRLEILRRSFPELPEALSDRQQDVAEPLLAVADLAGTEWASRARKALIELFGSRAAADESLGAKLLSDIREAFNGRDRLGSNELVTLLVEMEGSPWPECNKGRELTANTLARLLRRFDIAPRTIRGETDTFKGYLRAFFEDAWSRYLDPIPSIPACSTVTSSQPAQTLQETQFSEASHATAVTVSKSAPEPLFKGVVTPVTVEGPEQATRATRKVVIGEL